MILNFNKQKIQSNFNKAAAVYDEFAELQKIVADDLISLSKKYIDQSQIILDLGSGTGFIAKNIAANFKRKKIIQLDIAKKMLIHRPQNDILSVNADIEILPFKTKTFDLVISSMAFQWLNNLNQALLEISYILKPQAVLAFSIIADGSLSELKQACDSCEVNLSTNSFVKKSELKKALSDKFDNFQIKSKTITLKYDDALNLIKSIKSIGAGYSDNKKTLSQKDFVKINSFYLKNFNSDNKVIATWQIFYVICITNKL